MREHRAAFYYETLKQDRYEQGICFTEAAEDDARRYKETDGCELCRIEDCRTGGFEGGVEGAIERWRHKLLQDSERCNNIFEGF